MYLKVFKDTCILTEIEKKRSLQRPIHFKSRGICILQNYFYPWSFVAAYRTNGYDIPTVQDSSVLCLATICVWRAHLFFHHAEFLIHRFEVKSEKAWSIEQVLEVYQSDFPDPFVDGGHERSDGPVGEIEDLGRSWCYIRVTAT